MDAANARLGALWLLLVLLALMIGSSGFQGTTGRALAALLAPQLLQRS